jgi:hypothetical protein
VQLELEAALLATINRWFDLGVQARASIGGGDFSRPAFESARFFATLRPTDRVRLLGGFRYLDPATDYDAFPSFFTKERSYHANLDLAWDPKPWITLALVSGYDGAEREEPGLDQRFSVGAELGLPRLLRGRLSTSIGYREELGWYSGRLVYATLGAKAGDRFRVMSRLSYIEDRPSGSLEAPALRELAGSIFADGRIVRWLSARLIVTGRVGLDPNGEGAPPPGGLVLRAELVGWL